MLYFKKHNPVRMKHSKRTESLIFKLGADAQPDYLVLQLWRTERASGCHAEPQRSISVPTRQILRCGSRHHERTAFKIRLLV
jgi:hypothetical protein